MITLDGAVDQIVAQRLKGHILSDHVERIYQHTVVFKGVRRTKILEVYAIDWCDAKSRKDKKFVHFKSLNFKKT